MQIHLKYISDKREIIKRDWYLRSYHIAGQVEARCDTIPSKTDCFLVEREFPFLY